MRANFGYVGTGLQSGFLGMFDCINVLIWGGVKLTKFLKYTYNEIAAVIVSAAVVVWAGFQSRRDDTLLTGGGALLAMRNLRLYGIAYPSVCHRGHIRATYEDVVDAYEDVINAYEFNTNSYADGLYSYEDSVNSYEDKLNSYEDRSNSYEFIINAYEFNANSYADGLYSYEDKLNSEVKTNLSLDIKRHGNINNKNVINARAEIYQNQGNSKRVTAQIFNNFRLW